MYGHVLPPFPLIRQHALIQVLTKSTSYKAASTCTFLYYPRFLDPYFTSRMHDICLACVLQTQKHEFTSGVGARTTAGHAWNREQMFFPVKVLFLHIGISQCTSYPAIYLLQLTAVETWTLYEATRQRPFRGKRTAVSDGINVSAGVLLVVSQVHVQYK